MTDAVSRPASASWVRGRIITLLSHYFVNDMPDELNSAVAGDWIDVLMADPCPPEWALNAACRAWLGGPDSRRRPMPGQIRELAMTQMGWVVEARSRLFLHDHPSAYEWHPLGLRKWGPEPDDPSIDYEARKRQVAELLAVAVQKVEGE